MTPSTRRPLDSGHAFCGIILIVLAHAAIASAQTFTDPGFENYAVTSGGFVKPTSGPWSFANDAGVVEPFAPNSSTAVLNTWSATLPAIQGQQYVSTYAGGDFLRQTVSFSQPGDYVLSVFAAAPGGSITIPGQSTAALVDGRFSFTAAGTDVGALHTVPVASEWHMYTAQFTIASPGDYQLGIRNTLPAPYFINYDAFAVRPVPEPSTVLIGLLCGIAALSARKYWRARL